MAKWWKPPEAEILIEHTEDCQKQKYDYIYRDDVDPSDIGRITNWRMKKAQKHIRKFTNSNEDMLVEVSNTGRVVDYTPVPSGSLLKERGYARDETETENYTMVIEGYVDPFRINPKETIDTSEYMKTADAWKHINNDMVEDAVSEQPSAGGLNLGGMSLRTLMTVAFGIIVIIGILSQYM